jgi:hypothetical protein
MFFTINQAVTNLARQLLFPGELVPVYWYSIFLLTPSYRSLQCSWSPDMAAVNKNCRKKKAKRSVRSDKPACLSVVTVRISDEEKERIDEIMRNLQISRYSDVMRMALHMLKQHDFSRFTQAHSL